MVGSGKMPGSHHAAYGAVCFNRDLAITRSSAVELLTNPEVWVAFATLTVLEIVLGIDNIIFISILTGRLPEHQRARARFPEDADRVYIRKEDLSGIPVFVMGLAVNPEIASWHGSIDWLQSSTSSLWRSSLPHSSPSSSAPFP